MGRREPDADDAPARCQGRGGLHAARRAASLPEQRFFPADARVRRWLVSTPLVLGAADGSTRPAAATESTTTSGVTPSTTPDDSQATAGGDSSSTTVTTGSPAGSVIAAAEAEMAALVHTLRADLGLRALTYDADIAAVARRWSETMGAEGRLYHNPDYWRQYPAGSLSGAENASQVSAPLSLGAAVRRSFDSLSGSPLHYANMANADYTHLGIGIALDNDALWVTQNFAQYAPGTRTTDGTRPATGTGSTSESNGDSTRPDTSTGPTPDEPGNRRSPAVQRRPLA